MIWGKAEWDLEKTSCLEAYSWQINCGRNDLWCLRLNLFTKSALTLKSERQDHFVLFS